MEIISLLFATLYCAFMIGLCLFLISRGITHSFILLFGIGAVLQAMPRLAIFLMQRAPGGFGENMRWFPAISVLGMLGTLCFVAGFISLAAYLLRTRTPGA